MPKRVVKRVGKPNGRVFLGIDPGKSGGIATITQGGIVISYDVMPTSERDLWLLLSRMKGVHVAGIEKVHAFAGEAARASFTFGQGYGSLRMAMVAANISFREVSPKDWQRYQKIPPRKKGQSKPQHKETLRAKCQQLFPKLAVWEETLTKQRAVCDAIMIADFVRRSEPDV